MKKRQRSKPGGTELDGLESLVQESSLSDQEQLELWFQTALGRSLLASQRAAIDKATRRFFGFHQAEIGVSHRIPVGNLTNLGHKFYVLNKWEQDLPQSTVVSRHEEIALDHDMADLVILHHALDFSEDPHQTLREASRILKPSGHLVVVGFNPLSSWGLRRKLARNRIGPWACRFISGNRLDDWLNLLDFKVGGMRYHFYALPFNHQRLINRFRSLDNILNSKVPLGAYYIVVAQKQVGLRIRRSLRWRKNAKVVGMPVANRVDPK
jgi:SAM-dependent methyltransferase